MALNDFHTTEKKQLSNHSEGRLGGMSYSRVNSDHAAICPHFQHRTTDSFAAKISCSKKKFIMPLEFKYDNTEALRAKYGGSTKAQAHEKRNEHYKECCCSDFENCSKYKIQECDSSKMGLFSLELVESLEHI